MNKTLLWLCAGLMIGAPGVRAQEPAKRQPVGDSQWVHLV